MTRDISFSRLLDRRGARMLAILAIGFRAFYCAVVAGSELYNAVWITLLLGGALGLFPALLCAALGKWADPIRPAVEGRAAMLLWLVPLLWDGACEIQKLADSTGYAAAGTPHSLLLLLSTALLLYLLCLCGPGGAGGAARLYVRVAILLAVIALAVQIPRMRPRWLTPLFGPGWSLLWRGAFRVGAAFSLVSVLPIMTENHSQGAAISAVISAALIAAFMAACWGMMTPPLITAPDYPFFRLDTVLSNGRSPLALQFPIALIWYGGVFLSASYGILAAVRIGLCLLPRVRPSILCAVVVLIMLALRLTGLYGYAAQMEWVYYPLFVLPLILWTGVAALRKRRENA